MKYTSDVKQTNSTASDTTARTLERRGKPQANAKAEPIFGGTPKTPFYIPETSQTSAKEQQRKASDNELHVYLVLMAQAAANNIHSYGKAAHSLLPRLQNSYHYVHENFKRCPSAGI